MKIISMTDFVISQWDKDITREEFSQSMIAYATFLKQPLTLGMFVPCDENGNVLEEVKESYINSRNGSYGCYIEAKEKVLFKGFEVTREKEGLKVNYYLIHSKSKNTIMNKINGFGWELNRYKNLESLIDFDIELTESAIKQIGLNP